MTKTKKATPTAQKRTPRLTLAQVVKKQAELEATLNSIQTQWVSQSRELIEAHTAAHTIFTDFKRKYQQREDVLIQVAKTLAFELQLSAVKEHIQKETAALQAEKEGK